LEILEQIFQVTEVIFYPHKRPSFKSSLF